MERMLPNSNIGATPNTTAKKTSRPSFVCTNCRRRKVKCDRKVPCTRCMKSGLTQTCTYTVNLDDLGRFEVSGPNAFRGDEDGEQDEVEGVLKSRPLGLPDGRPNGLYPNASTDGSQSTGSMGNFTGNDGQDTLVFRKSQSALFNYRTLHYKRPYFVKDGDSVKYLSPISFEAIFSNNKLFVKFRSMMPFLFEQKEKEVEARRKTKLVNEEIRILSECYTKAEIDSLITQIVLPNVDAVKERISYFDQDLKSVMMCMFLPTSDLASFMDTHFVPYPANPGHYVYNPPPADSHEGVSYAIFANIFCIVQLVTIVTEMDEATNFQHALTFPVEHIGYLALKCMCFADYKNKPTFELLLAFLLYRINFYVIDSVSATSNSSVFFKIALEIAYNLGIHIRCDQFENHSEEDVRAAWNVIQFMDSVISLYMGEPLRIDYRYCVPRLYEYWEPIVLYLRNVVASFNSTEPISLNEIIDLANFAANLLAIFKPFDELLNDTTYGPVQYMFSLVIKADFVICYQMLLFILRLSIDEINELPITVDEDDAALVEDLKVKSECHLFYSLVVTFSLMKKISNGKISHRKQSVKLMVALRLLFSRFMVVGNKLIFCYLSVFNTKPKKMGLAPPSTEIFTKNEELKFSDISLFDAEKYLCRGLNGISVDDPEFKKMKALMKSLLSINEFLTDFYMSISDKSPLLLYGKFSSHFKFLMFICILLKNVYDFENFWSTRDEQVRFKIDYWKHVIDKTASYIKAIDQTGAGEFELNKWDLMGFDWDFYDTGETRENQNCDGESRDEGLDELYQLFF